MATIVTRTAAPAAPLDESASPARSMPLLPCARWAPGRPAPLGAVIGAIVAVAMTLPATADDLDVYRANIEARGTPNVLFVLDYSGSMRNNVDGGRASDKNPARIEILKEAVANVLEKNTGKINAGIGSIYHLRPSGVRWPISDLEVDAHTIDRAIPAGSRTAREALLTQLTRSNAGGYTQTVNALAEAARYFRGDTVTHDTDKRGDSRHRPDVWNVRDGRYAGGDRDAAIAASYEPYDAWDPDNETWKTPRYVSPITDSCTANSIVLISDGVPTRVNDNESLRQAAGGKLESCEDLSTSIFDETPGTTNEGNCGPEIVARLENEDQTAVPNSRVTTYAIGFAVDDDGAEYLGKLVGNKPGRFAEARKTDELESRLSAIVSDITAENEAFAELTVDIDRASFAHDDRAYFNIFRPTRDRVWPGNLKGYFIAPDGLHGIDGEKATRIDPKTGGHVFRDEAQSFWSADADGNDVASGGASQLIADNARRRLLTFTDSGGGALEPLAAGNDNITDALLGLPNGSPRRGAILDRLRSAPMAAPLHTRPVSLQYAGRKVVFTMTNQGFLHAIDATLPKDPLPGAQGGGEELFAFMPKRLLGNLPALDTGASTLGDFIYGLDGGITRWHEDENGNGIVDGDDSAVLIFGMRRGGSAFYALDVSDPEDPSLVWTIDPTTPGFERLGESWSRMALVEARSGKGRERFLVFGGGYDAATLDGVDERQPSRGNGLYVVDRGGKLVKAITGATQKAMRYAIPSDVTTIDVDSDGLADRLYVGDTGGQIWRVDFDDMRATGSYAVTRLADFSDSKYRPFFYPPSVALNRVDGVKFLSIAIGSGNRTDPNQTDSEDAFFMLRDADVTRGAPATSPSVASTRDLHDVGANRLDSEVAAIAAADQRTLDKARGWILPLADGEKSLSRLVSFEGRLLATTYEPDPSSDPAACAVDPIGRYYQLDIATARPALTSDGAGITDAGAADDSAKQPRRWREIGTLGIPPAPVIIFPEGGGAVQIVVGRETVQETTELLSKVYWRAR